MEHYDAMAVAGEWFGPVTAIHGAVEFLMRLHLPTHSKLEFLLRY